METNRVAPVIVEAENNPNLVAKTLSLIKRGYDNFTDFMEAKKVRMIGATAGTALAIGALSGCTVGAAPEVAPTEISTPSPEATSKPTPEKTETPKPSATPEAPSYTIGAEQLAELKGYEQLDGDQFNALPKPEQREFWMWKSEGIKDFADSWYEYSKNPADKYPEFVSENNSSAELATIQGYQIRFILSLEPAERENALISVLTNGKQSPAYTYWLDYFAQYPVAVTNAKVLAVSDALPINTASSFIGETQTMEGGLAKVLRLETPAVDMVMFYDTATANPNTGTVTPQWYRD